MSLYEELLKVFFAGILYYLFYRLKLRQPRLTYFQSGFASCQIAGAAGPVVVWIYQITIQNTGRAPARNVRVAHFFMPTHWQVIQTIPFTVEQINGQDRIIRFDTIEPNMLVTIAYLDTNHNRITTAHDHVRSDEGMVSPTPVQLQRVFPRPVIWTLTALILLGAYTGVSLLYSLIQWLRQMSIAV